MVLKVKIKIELWKVYRVIVLIFSVCWKFELNKNKLVDKLMCFNGLFCKSSNRGSKVNWS